MGNFAFFTTRKEYEDSNIDINHKFYGYINSPKFIFSGTDKEDMGMNESDLRILSKYYNKKYKSYCQDGGECIVTIIGICRDHFDWYLVAKKKDGSLDVIFAYDTPDMCPIENLL